MDQNRLKTVLSFSNRHGDWISRRSERCCSCGRYSYFGVFFGIMTRLERRLRTNFLYIPSILVYLCSLFVDNRTIKLLQAVFKIINIKIVTFQEFSKCSRSPLI